MASSSIRLHTFVFMYSVRSHAASPAATAGSSFSQGFLLLGFSAGVPCPSNTVFGISLIPGTGCPVVMSSTMCAKEVGYGAGGSLEPVGAGNTPLGASLTGALLADAGAVLLGSS